MFVIIILSIFSAFYNSLNHSFLVYIGIKEIPEVDFTFGAFIGLFCIIGWVFAPLDWISMCVINYTTYCALALLITYGVCYIRALKSK